MISTRPASRTLGDLVDEMARVTPTAEAIVFRDERLDYAGLKARVDDFARALLAVGIRKGDRVGVLVTNRTEWVTAAFAVAKIGAIVTAISTFSTPRELAWMLEHSGAVALVTIDSFRGRGFLGALRSLCPELDGAAPGALSSPRLPAFHTVVTGLAAIRRRFLAAGVFGPRRFGRCGDTRRCATGRGSKRHLLHSLHFGIHGSAQGGNPGTRAAHR